MKKTSILFIFIAAMFLNAAAQTTVIIRPDSSNSNDLFVTALYPNSGYPLSTEFITAAWTCNNLPCVLRSLIKFDLSIIPPAATVLSATFSVYAHPNQISGNAAFGPTYGTYNLSFLRKVVSPWNTATVTWNTLPAYTTLDQVTFPTSTTNYQDYPNMNVLNMVQDMVTNPATNYGFLFQLDVEAQYNCMIFCSSEFSDSTKRPKLEITYVDFSGITENNDELNYATVSPNPANSTISIDFGLNKPALINYEMADAAGRKILFAHAGIFPAGAHRINLSDEIKVLPNGIYYFGLSVNDAMTNKKIVVMHSIK